MLWIFLYMFSKCFIFFKADAILHKINSQMWKKFMCRPYVKTTAKSTFLGMPQKRCHTLCCHNMGMEKWSRNWAKKTVVKLPLKSLPTIHAVFRNNIECWYAFSSWFYIVTFSIVCNSYWNFIKNHKRYQSQAPILYIFFYFIWMEQILKSASFIFGDFNLYKILIYPRNALSNWRQYDCDDLFYFKFCDNYELNYQHLLQEAIDMFSFASF